MNLHLQSPMVVAAARALCKLSAEACNVNEADLWNLESESFKAEALAVLNAAGAPELLEALQALRIAELEDCSDASDILSLRAKADAAIAKATGDTPCAT